MLNKFETGAINKYLPYESNTQKFLLYCNNFFLPHKETQTLHYFVNPKPI